MLAGSAIFRPLAGCAVGPDDVDAGPLRLCLRIQRLAQVFQGKGLEQEAIECD